MTIRSIIICDYCGAKEIYKSESEVESWHWINKEYHKDACPNCLREDCLSNRQRKE